MKPKSGSTTSWSADIGEVIAEPDFSTISIVSMGESATSEEAAANCAAVTQQVKDIAGEQSVLTKYLTTSGVTLSTNTRESDGAVTGYVARETITIIENNVEQRQRDSLSDHRCADH